MADYPDLPIDARSFRLMFDDGSESSRADSGVLRIRRLWPEVRVTITMVHPGLEWNQYTDLLQFYMNNRADSQINFTVPEGDSGAGQSFLVSIVSPPTPSETFGTKLYNVRVELEGVMSGNA